MVNKMSNTILFSLFGFLLSYGVMFANSRSIIINKMISELDITIFDLSFAILLTCLLLGVMLDMIIRPRMFNERTGGVELFLTNYVMMLFVVMALPVMASVSGFSTFTSMLNELVNWGIFFGFVFVISFIHYIITR